MRQISQMAEWYNCFHAGASSAGFFNQAKKETKMSGAYFQIKTAKNAKHLLLH